MPDIHPFHKVVQEVASAVMEMRESAVKANPIPFGEQRVSMETWRKTFQSPTTPKAIREKMLGDLGPDRRSQLRELYKRMGPRVKGPTPFGGEA